MLTAKNIIAGYGKKGKGLKVLKDVSIDLESGEIVCLIGPNGAGKSTLLKILAGILQPWEGEVVYNRETINYLDCPGRVKRGIVYFMQGGVVFPNMTVKENLEVGVMGNNREKIDTFEEIFQLFPEVKNWLSRRAGLLSGGQRQQVALAMILLKHPRILLLDEASAGLAPNLVRETMNKVKEINRLFGTGILIVEQNVGEALKISHRMIALRNGEVVANSNKPEDYLENGMLENLFIGKATLKEEIKE